MRVISALDPLFAQPTQFSGAKIVMLPGISSLCLKNFPVFSCRVYTGSSGYKTEVPVYSAHSGTGRFPFP
jgi:hypothetical protein